MWRSLLIFACWAGYVVVTSVHYGWNIGAARSEGELIAEGIGLVLLAMAIISVPSKAWRRHNASMGWRG